MTSRYQLRNRGPATEEEPADTGEYKNSLPGTFDATRSNMTSPSIESKDVDGPSGPTGPEEASVLSADEGVEGKAFDYESDAGTTSSVRKARSLDDIRRQASIPVEQLNAIELAQSKLTRSQKDLIIKRRRAEARARRDSVSSRGEGPSKPKGKGVDPKNWGALDLSDSEIEAQQVLYESLANDKSVRIKDEESDSEGESTDKSARQRRNRKQGLKYKERAKALKKRSGAASKDVNEMISVSAAGGRKKTKKRTSKKKKSSILKPTEQLDKKSYINNAFKRTEKLDGNKGKKQPTYDSSDPDSSGDDSDSSKDESDKDSSSDSSDSDPSDDSDSGDDSSDDRRPSKKTKSTSWKPITPESYDGRPNIASFHRFMSACIMYLEDANIPKNRRVYRLSTFLKGHAYTCFYGRKTNAQTDTNSNQDKFRRHHNKTEQNRKDWRDKSKGQSKHDAEEKARLKAEGKCYICKESTTHMARNCPKANSVNTKGSSSNIQSYSVEFSTDKAEQLRELAETTQVAHELEVSCNAMGLTGEWSIHDYDLNELDFDSGSEYSSWADEVEDMLYSPEPTEDAALEDFELGDPVLEKIEGGLLHGAPYAQDRRRGAQTTSRFTIETTEGGPPSEVQYNRMVSGETRLKFREDPPETAHLKPREIHLRVRRSRGHARSASRARWPLSRRELLGL
ncbi:hypothetical protein DFP72DRAFT_1039464 [Ephemerocybe angulata]|uniref:CCHC-type domain-containing protein n=1 Tax=Ephemerocybe angulata TaxID=980116 RepID=A0A8H6IKJ1_9AGAR|nr:hypothetical protein DFP72DRAFT_1039464 [Tulosesus angulatus]